MGSRLFRAGETKAILQDAKGAQKPEESLGINLRGFPSWLASITCRMPNSAFGKSLDVVSRNTHPSNPATGGAAYVVVVQTWAIPKPAMQDVMFETLARILELDSPRCQGDALHGLGHLHHPETQQLVERYIASYPAIAPEQKKYALAAAQFKIL